MEINLPDTARSKLGRDPAVNMLLLHPCQKEGPGPVDMCTTELAAVSCHGEICLCRDTPVAGRAALSQGNTVKMGEGSC